MSDVMGYHGKLYYGTKGSTAATQITGRKEVNYKTETSVGDTTEAGAGSNVPITTGEATQITPSLDFSLVFKNNSSAITALLAASKTGNPIAIRYIPEGTMNGFDCDCVIDDEQGSPLDGEATLKFTVKAVSNALRTPVLNG